MKKQGYIANTENKGENIVKLHKISLAIQFDIHKTQFYNVCP